MENLDKYRRQALRGIQAQGKKELLQHLDGERLTQRQAILAKCFDCMGYYMDGKHDCKMPQCSLSPFMPYRKGEQRQFVQQSKKNSNALAEGRGDVSARQVVEGDRRPVL